MGREERGMISGREVVCKLEGVVSGRDSGRVIWISIVCLETKAIFRERNTIVFFFGGGGESKKKS